MNLLGNRAVRIAAGSNSVEPVVPLFVGLCPSAQPAVRRCGLWIDAGRVSLIRVNDDAWDRPVLLVADDTNDAQRLTRFSCECNPAEPLEFGRHPFEREFASVARTADDGFSPFSLIRGDDASRDRKCTGNRGRSKDVAHVGFCLLYTFSSTRDS